MMIKLQAYFYQTFIDICNHVLFDNNASFINVLLNQQKTAKRYQHNLLSDKISKHCHITGVYLLSKLETQSINSI